jgi:DNA-binding CsgD family transcriptional regulator
MDGLIYRRSGWLAGFSVAAGISVFVALEIYETPTLTPTDLLLGLVELVPIVLLSVGFVLLFRMAMRQRDDQLAVIRDLEVARVEGHRWRTEARTLLNGLGEAIDQQFSRWNLTEAEREVALLLLKGLSLKEVAQVRATSERTIRAQTRSLYAKAGVSGRAALSAFFLEDLLAPIENVR